jgi:hypothetical protein
MVAVCVLKEKEKGGRKKTAKVKQGSVSNTEKKLSFR